MVWLPRNLPEPGRSSLSGPVMQTTVSPGADPAGPLIPPGGNVTAPIGCTPKPGTGRLAAAKTQFKATRNPRLLRQRVNAESRRLVLQGQLDPATREGPGHSDDGPTWGTASSQVVNGSVPVVLEGSGPRPQVHARYIGGTREVHRVADTRVPHRPASRGPVASSPTRKTVRLFMRDHPGPDECCEVLAEGAGHQELQILGADGTAGHGELGFLVVLRPWHWARVSAERHFLALRRGQ
jgi:hypothetical protein